MYVLASACACVHVCMCVCVCACVCACVCVHLAHCQLCLNITVSNLEISVVLICHFYIYSFAGLCSSYQTLEQLVLWKMMSSLSLLWGLKNTW